MAVIDLSKKALGTSAKVRKRRLAVLRYLLRGYTYMEAWEALQRMPWWEGWSAQVVNHDMVVLRRFIKDYGEVIPGYKEAVSWALSYYEDTIKEYDQLARKYEDMEKYELAARYRSMRDALAAKAFNALGVNSFNVSIAPGQGTGGGWEALKVFFGIDTPKESERTDGHKINSKSKADKKRAGHGKQKGKAKTKNKKGKDKGENKG